LNGKLHWAHGWHPNGYNPPSGVKYIPSFAHKNQFDGSVPSAEYVLFFNEPNCHSCGGAQPIAAQEAAGLFRKLAAKTSAKIIVGNFAVTSTMESWFRDFKSACSDCHWHGVGIHPYDANPMAHVARIKKLADGKPIWLTEFNAGGGDHVGLIRKFVPQFESDPDIEGYLWCIHGSEIALSNGGGSLTAIGKAFDEVLR
jgi:hypothetical protein